MPAAQRLYKIFLVEDEIVIRQGIRDRIDWPAAGFEFCGEASDGEMALPLIQAARPDLLITDIKMPFMNGLELARIVRETMPEIKIIILSGHDEFAYAREAIKLGVTEYLLKPLTAQDLLDVLHRLSQQLDHEQAEHARLNGLQLQVEGSQPALREKFLLQLVLGGVSAVEALEKSLQLKLNLIARCYLILLVRSEFFQDPAAAAFDYETYRRAEEHIAAVVRRSSDVLAFNKGLEETILILKGDSFAHLEQDSDLLVETIRQEVEHKMGCCLQIALSAPCERLGDLPRAFHQARTQLDARKAGPSPEPAPGAPARPTELLKLDPGAPERFLKVGSRAGFDDFFAAFIAPLKDSAPTNRLFLEYISLDLLLTAANFVNDLGGQAEQVIPELAQSEQLLNRLRTFDQVTSLARTVFNRAFEFRDRQATSQYDTLIRTARAYIDHNLANPALSLAEVAARVNLSPSHFSVVFSRETGETFIEYLTRQRINQARLLLRTTSLRTAEIAERVGYDNPHYFSTVFKKITGQSPTDFRSQV